MSHFEVLVTIARERQQQRLATEAVRREREERLAAAIQQLQAYLSSTFGADIQADLDLIISFDPNRDQAVAYFQARDTALTLIVVFGSEGAVVMLGTPHDLRAFGYVSDAYPIPCSGAQERYDTLILMIDRVACDDLPF